MFEKWTEPPISTTWPIWLLMDPVALMSQCNQRLAIPQYHLTYALGVFYG